MSVDESKNQNTALSVLVLTSVFLVAICGLVYELIAGTLSSYLLGDSTTQFSLTIGLFLTAMGIGSYLSRFLAKQLFFWFVAVEILIGVVGGFSALAGFAAFAYTESYVLVLGTFVVVIGILVGLEIPLVIRILKEVQSLRVTVANVFTVDYLGAFAASLLFPFFLLPQLGLVRASLVVGIANVLIGALLLRGLRHNIKNGTRFLAVACILALVTLSGTTIAADSLVSSFENRVYQDEVIYSSTSRYQHIVLTRWREDVRLYLNGHLQFSSVDEYRYHEALAVPAMAACPRARSVLVLGGGDGLLAKQLLKYKTVEDITICDLDEKVTDLFKEREMLRALNDNSLRASRVSIINQDAMAYLEGASRTWDVILIDLPDPSESSIAKLYSQAFYRLVLSRLSQEGVMATQATSPFKSRKSFWCIEKTIKATKRNIGDDENTEGFRTRPYHAYIPTFGTWGFVLASRRPINPSELSIEVSTRFLNRETLASMFTLPKDMAPVEVPINRLNDPVLSRLYRNGYHKYLD